MTSLIHKIEQTKQLPSELNNPFVNTPPQCVMEGVAVVKTLLEQLYIDYPNIIAEIKLGKMLGLLIVELPDGSIGLLAAFSGSLAGEYVLPGFVPPIYQLDGDSGYFKEEEGAISQLNTEIKIVEQSEELQHLKSVFKQKERESKEQLSEAKREYEKSRRSRSEQRKESLTPQQLSDIDRESQHQKGELRRLRQRLDSEISAAKEPLETMLKAIDKLKRERADRSNLLQRRLFESYKVLNGRGEMKSIYDIFIDSTKLLPPAGTGECAAPKLLHYALKNGLRPIAIGEFWVGDSPRGEVRIDGEFYGACVAKCHPLLKYMLQGIDYSADTELSQALDIDTIYEDDYLLVVNKPAGLLSVSGREQSHSVESIIRERYPLLDCSIMVHRLDQDTSGLMVVSKSRDVHSELQRQFAVREVKKQYIAVVAGDIDPMQGEINLPLSSDYLNRPRQRVDYERGKEARTIYNVLQRGESTTRLLLQPLSGRTHQLRIHCASSEGLAAPILGDRLYGRNDGADRLHLHAQTLEFTHPHTYERVRFDVDAEF